MVERAFAWRRRNGERAVSRDWCQFVDRAAEEWPAALRRDLPWIAKVEVIERLYWVEGRLCRKDGSEFAEVDGSWRGMSRFIAEDIW